LASPPRWQTSAAVCRDFELWSGSHIVYGPRHIAEEVRQLNERHQEAVVRTEEMIPSSRWRIAESKRLIERLNGRADGGLSIPRWVPITIATNPLAPAASLNNCTHIPRIHRQLLYTATRLSPI